MHCPPRKQQFGESDPGPVLVTGGNGYIASWLVKRLLERGFDVRATVRDPADPRKTEHLLAMAEESSGTLSLFRADLLEPGAFDRAMAGCAIVFHTASPVVVRGVENPVRELIEPATQGTCCGAISAAAFPSPASPFPSWWRRCSLLATR